MTIHINWKPVMRKLKKSLIYIKNCPNALTIGSVLIDFKFAKPLFKSVYRIFPKRDTCDYWRCIRNTKH